MIGLTDLFLAARSRRRRHSLEEHDPEPVRLVRTPAASLAKELRRHATWHEDSDATRTAQAKQFKFVASLLVSGRISEGTP